MLQLTEGQGDYMPQSYEPIEAPKGPSGAWTVKGNGGTKWDGLDIRSKDQTKKFLVSNMEDYFQN